MSDFYLSQRSKNSYRGVEPTFAAAVLYGMHLAFERYGIDSGAIEGLRSQRRQEDLLLEDKSQVKHSKHQAQSDGFGHALDLLAGGDLNDDGIVDHHDRALRWEGRPYMLINDCVQEGAGHFGIEITWGGDWNRNGVIVTEDPAESFLDAFHWQLVS